MKLLVDMNLSPRWVGLLEDAGIKAVDTDLKLTSHYG
ncbi:hypothetical protein SAMN05421510_10656 [Nitrosomonas ureae]|uniref:DUF5615 domain-containing protein n=1 Tax=Nitrosomonas ureae TaxID=44577 RepID=A0A1H9GIE6_9PROT|nr:hypothetical protein SAMN05216406_13724 [Nitrosomonas ureae]SEQ49803.1 hypothetical protein SAMN05421510_10656 [Nitrosomonas ureae]